MLCTCSREQLLLADELVDYLLQAGHFKTYFFCKDGHYDFYLTG